MPPKKQQQSDGHEEVVYSWELIDDIYVPAIFRKKTKYVPVRIVELKLLTRFPRMIPSELKKVQKCKSYYITKEEVSVINEINKTICKGEFGKKSFNENDVVVELDEFKTFFELVADTVISRSAIDMGFTNGGWLQLNNTVCPYVWVSNVRHVPYEVVTLAAELVDETDEVTKILVTDKQLAFLNKLCSNSQRTFSFDENTELISLIWLKLNANPVVIELPSDSPFDHAVFIDIQSSEKTIQEIKSTARESLNAFYNHSIIARFKLPDVDLDETGTPSAEKSAEEVNIQESQTINKQEVVPSTTSLANVKNLSKINHEKTKTTPLTELLSQEVNKPSSPQDPAGERSKSSASVRSDDSENPTAAASTAHAKTTEQEIKSERVTKSDGTKKTESKESSTKRTLRPSGPPDPMENRYAPEATMTDRYRIHSLTSESRYLSATPAAIRDICNHDAALKVLLKAVPSQDTRLDMAALQLISRCVNIQAKVLCLFSHAFAEMKEQEPYRVGLERDYLLEAMAVVQDATRNFSFWNASAHKVSLGGAERINTSLVTAVLGDHSYSFPRSPDIVHFMVSGVFGARTLPGAKNFRFLQDVMSIAFIATGMTDINPMVGYAIVCNTFDELVSSLMNWCQVVSVKALQMDMVEFVALTYKLYEKVYSSVKFTPRDMRLPAPPGTKAVPPPPPYNKVTYPPPRQQQPKPSTITQPQSSMMSQAHQQQMLLMNRQGMVIDQQPMLRHPATQPRPMATSLLALPNTTPASAAAAVTQPLIMTVPQSAQQSLLVTNQPVSRPSSQASDADFCISSVTSLNSLATQQDTLVLPAQPQKVLHSVLKSVCTVPPTKLDPNTDLADAITLVRSHGKKIPVFKKGNDSWLLVEDVQKTYFPRNSLQRFVEDTETFLRGLMVPISAEVDIAFRHHYDMTDAEHFEVLLMIAFKSLPEIMNHFNLSGNKRQIEPEDTPPAKKHTM